MTRDASPFGLHGPTDDAAREEVQHESDVEPALSCPDIGEVSQPLLVRPVGLEVPVEDVVGDNRPFAVVLRLSKASGPRPQGIDPHQPFDPVQAAGKPLFQQIVPDAASPVGPVAGLEARLDCRDKLGAMDLAGADRTIERSQAWKPDRETSSTSHSQLTGQMWRCLAMKANLMSPLARKKLLSSGCHAPPGAGRSRVCSNRWRSPAHLVFSAAIWARSARICPFPGNAVTGVAVSSRIQRRRTLSDTSRPQAACATATPRSVTSLTASILNSRLNFHLVISTLQFLGHDLIFVSKTPAAGQMSPPI